MPWTYRSQPPVPKRIAIDIDSTLHHYWDQLAAAGGSLDAASGAVEECLDHEPGWFAVQEVDALLEDLWLDEPGGRATIG